MCGEGRWTGHADTVGRRGEEEQPSGPLGPEQRHVSDESLKMPLIFKCRQVFLQAPMLTSPKTHAECISYLVTTHSEAGLGGALLRPQKACPSRAHHRGLGACAHSVKHLAVN